MTECGRHNFRKDPHEDLLDEWATSARHLNKIFVRDGIIDPLKWCNALRKVLFILREAYADPPVSKDWDLRECIRDWKGPKYKIWWTVSYWAYALHRASPHSTPEFPVDATAVDAARDALLSCAVINIKKSDGSCPSHWDDLTKYGREDGYYIRRQVDLINPEIIVCGNVWSLIQESWPNAKRVYDMVWVSEGRTIVDFWHPANQYPNQLNYYALAALFQNSGALERCSATEQN